MKSVVSLKNNLISLTDKVFPGVNELFTSPEKADGHQKWVDFISTFWHCDCICRVSEKAFTERYQKWCKRNSYNFSKDKALDLYATSCGQVTTLPKNNTTKILVTTAAKQLTSVKTLLAGLKSEIISISKQLPEYSTVIDMFGVGDISAFQLMAEIGDVRRFPNRSSLVALVVLTPLLTNQESMNYIVTIQLSAVLLTFEKRCIRLSVPMLNARLWMNLFISSSVKNVPRANRTLYI